MATCSPKQWRSKQRVVRVRLVQESGSDQYRSLGPLSTVVRVHLVRRPGSNQCRWLGPLDTYLLIQKENSGILTIFVLIQITSVIVDTCLFIQKIQVFLNVFRLIQVNSATFQYLLIYSEKCKCLYLIGISALIQILIRFLAMPLPTGVSKMASVKS